MHALFRKDYTGKQTFYSAFMAKSGYYTFLCFVTLIKFGSLCEVRCRFLFSALGLVKHDLRLGRVLSWLML